MDAGSSLNSSSIINLKAELHKKYESFRNLKLSQNTAQSSKRTPLKNKGETAKVKVKQNTDKLKVVDSEEDLALKKSRLALEAKAKLYDKIVSSSILIDDEQKESYLVDFERKVLYNSQEPDRNKTIESTNSSHVTSTCYNSYELQAGFVKQEDKSSDLEDPERPLHYQNVQYNEVRDHGTGYFSFSMDEKERKEQMEELNSLRHETEAQRLKRQKLHQKRKALIQARLAKICERKNIDQSALEAYADAPKEETTEQPANEEVDILSIPLPETDPVSVNQEQVEKKPKIRPWDIGKDNLQQFVPKKKIKSQNQWIGEKREERPSEFAPPSFYK